MSMVEMYWLTRLDAINTLFIIGAVISLLSILPMGAMLSEQILESPWWTLLPISFLALFSVAATFTPSTKSMCAILVVPQIVNNEKVQELPENVLNLANEWLKEQVIELKEKNNGK